MDKKELKIITGLGGVGTDPETLKRIIKDLPKDPPSLNDCIIISVDSNPSKNYDKK